MDKGRLNQSTLEGDRVAEVSLAKEIALDKPHEKMGKTDYLNASMKATGLGTKDAKNAFLSINT